ncbi:MAG TPA: sigma 54-interacting transcriptional regulator [Polyangiaceae bacterium]|jgi:transcriptional regulator with PAS, ATPase and Fis domain|nr:sigma 54-interacting transcriptional regulator [Polyangiaceae bacterium]
MSDDVITRSLDATANVTVAALDLLVIDGPDRGARKRLELGKVRIGTAPGNDVVLTDATVSRLHCELHVRPHGFRVVDLESTNGTFIGAVRVHDAELAAGATVTLGGTTLRIELAGEPVTLEISPIARFGDLLGQSFEMRRIYAILDRVAGADVTVLVTGETGTGKEAVAQAIHDASRRADGAFVAVDCGAIAENLVESELFGHVRGAFSGAVAERRGLFEEASGGTLFLDEIGELPLALQPKLLRALETREVRRVGANSAKKVDVRVVAATNRSLAKAVNDGIFREDLYYRLAVVEVELPPLRARREDIRMLAQNFYERFSGSRDPLPDALVRTLESRGWPGNVRELRNFVERSISLGWSAEGNAVVESAPADPSASVAVPTHLQLRDARAWWSDQFERVYVTTLLKKTNGNVTRAAELAGVNRRSLQRLMVQHGLRSDDDSLE